MKHITKKAKFSLIAVVLAGMFASSCAQIIQGDDYDPWEPFNRGMYEINYMIDGLVLKPVTQIYRGVMPERGQKMVHNFVLNLQEPLVFGNSVLQLDPENSFVSLWRFLLNSTIGVGGLFDVASEVGLIERRTDFGQTLALYGVESGPYLFLPILGPSNLRDGTGRVADAFMHPAMYVDNNGASIALWTITAVDTRSDNYDLIEEIQKTSLDPYVTFRSAYTQRRAQNIKKARAARNAAWEKAKAAR